MNTNEAKLMTLLKTVKTAKASQLSVKLDLSKDIIARLAYSLSKKGLVELEKEETFGLKLTNEGKEVKKTGLPERNLLLELPKKPEELNTIALNWALKRRWAEMKKGKVVAILKDPPQTREEALLDKLKDLLPEAPDTKLLTKRKWIVKKKEVDYTLNITTSGKTASVEEKITQVTQNHLMGGKWKKLEFQTFSPNTKVPEIYAGRFHPLTDTIEKVRRVFLEMGFTESKGPHVTNAFWNFDALFVPQDHPAREMQDTFYLDGEDKLPEVSKKVKTVHEKFWGGWDENEAKRRLLRTHTTARSAKLLTEVTPPAKVFQIGRNFRNETVDYKHGAEFYQVEGIVVDRDANFNNLVGYLKEFFKKLGIPKIRIRPGYFPYTEMSAEVDVWFSPKNSWMELGGAGIFRPELVEPLLGEDVPVLAWGLGLERVAMMNYKINDFRKLYKSDLKTLRNRRSLL
ncbi:MAG: phenylalanine--tRNA ligase subunit alpha [Candidatus Altiarchaeota archaeon]|nr:phenylalanine--tRNA ligase subunit alpha [Candidatus Altiarchaeota archaeon]